MTFNTLILFIFLLSINGYSYAIELQFINKEKFVTNSVVQLSILDAEILSKKIQSSEKIEIQLALNENSTLKNGAFEIKISHSEVQIHAGDSKALSDGIYEYLQQFIGIKFYHPRESLFPENLDAYPKQFHLIAEPAFEHRGFHLHTMHPLELTEDFLNETRPNALENIKEYINWLARNGQNYFEFNVLESINTAGWMPHAQQISSYAHARGIRCGLDLSLNMLQQKAYQLYESAPFEFESAKKQLIRNSDYMLQAGFDVWNVELSATEFSSGNQNKKTELLTILTQKLKENHVKLMSRNHVVKPDQMVNAGGGKEASEILTNEQGLMVHTVMFYSMLDQKAPVYRNENLLHMRDILLTEKDKRETWYFPESAYWVTFDNSVPMLLLPYFKARLDDINFCDSLKIKGHLTFSSGWEWGYGLIDYSIARWSWNFKKNNQLEAKTPLQYVLPLIQNAELKTFVAQELIQQESWIKEKELIKVMVAQTVTDELPGTLNIEFHPRPEFSYPYIRNKANKNELIFIESKYIQPLKQFGERTLFTAKPLNQVESEIIDGLNISILRAKHKHYTLKYLVEKRRKKATKEELKSLLQEAENIRSAALKIVKNREVNYRYPLQDIAHKNKNSTCYNFGYLYTVHQLHFWEREEKQALKNKYNFLFKNIWSVGKTIGLTD